MGNFVVRNGGSGRLENMIDLQHHVLALARKYHATSLGSVSTF